MRNYGYILMDIDVPLKILDYFHDVHSRNTILKIQLKITSLALVVETLTEHNNT